VNVPAARQKLEIDDRLRPRSPMQISVRYNSGSFLGL
jgi:hypothetical protein